MIYTYIWSLAYVVTEENKLCSDDGKLYMNENECKKAAEHMGLEYGLIRKTPDYPKGCYKGLSQNSAVRFNRNSVGSRQSSIKSICKNLGTT